MHPFYFFALLAVGAGICLPLQAAANGRLRGHLDQPLWAAFLSICGTILFAVLTMLALRPTVPSSAAFARTEWWNYIGGPLGALIVLSGATLVRELGATVFIALVIAGQLICSLVLDHYALFALPEQPISPGRIFGVLLVVAGVVCVKYL